MTYSGLELILPVVPIETLKLEFDTTIIEAQEGYEKRIPRWTEYRASIMIDTLTLTKKELDKLTDFYTTVNGNLGSFKYKNHIEYKATHDFDIYSNSPNVYSIGMLFPAGGGRYQLIKSYRIGADFANWNGGYKTIRKVDLDTLSIYGDGVRIFDYIADSETGLVEINEDISSYSSLTFEAEYYHEMRFNMETLDATQISPTDYQVNSISLVEEVTTTYSPLDPKDWVDLEFEFSFPFEPSNIEKSEFKIANKSLKNERETRKIRDLYLKVLVELESNVLTEAEKGLLATWFCATKGRKLKFQYKGLPFRFNIDNLSLSSVRLEENSDYYYKYSNLILYNRSETYPLLPGVEVVIPEPKPSIFPRAGLVAYWKMDEESGTRFDSVGSNNFVEDRFHIPSASGIIDMGASFNKQGKLQNSTLTTFNSDTSISVWVKFTNIYKIGGDYILSRISANSSGEQFQLVKTNPGNIAFVVSNNNQASGRVAINHNIALVSNKFYLLTVTYDSTTGEIIFYVDGSVVGTISVLNISQPTLPLLIGGFTNGGHSENNLDGVIDELGIWHRVLTQVEVNKIYNSGNGIPLPAKSV